MKRTLVIEIDVPENVDHAWNLDKSGFQAFGDTVQQYAMLGATKMLAAAYSDENVSGEAKDRYVQFILNKNEVVNSMRMAGYIENNQYFERDDTRYAFKEPVNITPKSNR
jgi:hypothetical protein